MAMLDLLEKEIDKLNLTSGNLPSILTALADSIPSRTVPQRMKIALAVSEIMSFASQFRINIRHWNNSSIPINSIMFCLAKSGMAKDSSVRAVRKCFEEAYGIISTKRKENARQNAINEAKLNGSKNPETYSNWIEYYIPPQPLFLTISTPEGLIQHLNELHDNGLGAGIAGSSEIGQDLISNPNISEFIKLISILYDMGNYEVKALKSKELQTKEIKGMPMNALFLGSQDNIIFDSQVKNRFKLEFTTKLARRSFFIFVNEDIKQHDYQSIQEMIDDEIALENKSIESRNKLIPFITDLCKDLIQVVGNHLTVSKEVRELFTLYKKYNECLAETITLQYPISKLTRAHMQWKAFKLSGAFALMENSNSIELNHYRAGIEFTESIYNDIKEFENELAKEPYELFARYCHSYAVNGIHVCTLHTLKKLGFISKVNSVKSGVKELQSLVTSYDNEGIYKVDENNSIIFQLLKKEKTLGISYLTCTGTKQQRAKNCSEGFEYQEFEFSDVAKMLLEDVAYSPFKFLDGKRSRENVIGGCKWIVMDIDESTITDEDAHIMLSDINHCVARTSNKTNPYKYRVAIELDSVVNVDDTQWVKFIKSIGNDFGLNPDPLPKSQIFFSYSGRKVLSELEATPLEVKPYLMMLEEKKVPNKEYTQKEKSDKLNNPLETFNPAFEAKSGEGRKKMIWAAREAQRLGADLEYIENLLYKINNYWVKPMPDESFKPLVRSVSKWF